MNDMSSILVLAPHTDDGEIGCGATISKYLRRGEQVYYAAFSTCAESLPDGFGADTLKNELYEATCMLKIPEKNVFVFDYEVRNFASRRQNILDDIIRLGEKIQPDIVFMPSVNDIHQDHSTISAEGLRAFKKTTVFCYEIPWNNFYFNNQAFSCVEEQDVVNKLAAIKCYKSQRNKAYTSDEYIWALLKSQGIKIGAKFAEVFEVPRILI